MKEKCFTFTVIMFSVLALARVAFSSNEKEQQIVKAASEKFPQVSWQSKSVVSADINCDNIDDAAIIGIERDTVQLFLWLGPLANSSAIETLMFPLGDSSSQIAMCGNSPKLAVEGQKHDLYDELGGNPEGYRKSERCKGLKLYDEMCDSIHIYWNHDTNKLSYYRF